MPVRRIALNKEKRANYDNDRPNAGKNCAILSAFGTTLSRDRTSLSTSSETWRWPIQQMKAPLCEIEFEAFCYFLFILLLFFEKDSFYLIPSFTGPFASFFPNRFPTRAGSIRISS